MSDKYAALRASAEGAFSSWSRNMTASTKDILALLAEHDADKRNIEKLRLALRRYSMSAGQADQRKSESIAVRMALGFDADAEDVAPVDLCECIEALKNRVAELEARTPTVKLPSLNPQMFNDDVMFGYRKAQREAVEFCAAAGISLKIEGEQDAR